MLIWDFINLTPCQGADKFTMSCLERGWYFEPDLGDKVYVPERPDIPEEYWGHHLVTSTYYDGRHKNVITFANRKWLWNAFRGDVNGEEVTEHFVTLQD